MKKVFYWLLNKELFRYGIIGFLTTLINIAVFVLCRRFEIDYRVSNTIAFIIAVLFAFIANDRVVFKVKQKDTKSILKRMVKFFTMRIGSYFADMFLLIILIDKFGYNEVISKAITNIVVIILNYIMSKYYIFNRN
jgi:putative flippase GtrA